LKIPNNGPVNNEYKIPNVAIFGTIAKYAVTIFGLPS
jgi:hypothetical protein